MNVVENSPCGGKKYHADLGSIKMTPSYV